MTTSSESPTDGGAREALEHSKTVLLVDWHEDVPRSLIAAGYDVFSFEGSYFQHAIATTSPGGDVRVVAPSKPQHRGFLVYLPLDAPPPSVDLVCTYRPADEQAGIVEAFVLPLRARWFWVERGDESRVGEDPDAIIEGASDEARAACAAAGVAVIEGLSVPLVLAATSRS
jgi:predicted CoA-binding protein